MSREKLNPDIKELIRAVHKLYSIICEIPAEFLFIPKGVYRQELGDILGLDDKSIQNYSRPERDWPCDPEFYKVLVPGIDKAIMKYAQNLKEQEQETFLKKWSAYKEIYFKSLDTHYIALQYLGDNKRILSKMYIPEYKSRYFLTEFLKGECSNSIDKMDDSLKEFCSFLRQQLAIYPDIDKNLLPMDEYYKVCEIRNLLKNIDTRKIHFDLT